MFVRNLMVGVFAVVMCGIVMAADRDRFAAGLDGLVEELMDDSGVPGVAVGLIRDGEVVIARGYGLADVESGEKVTADTLFQAASISKTVTAWGVMKLVEEGRLELDTPVEEYLTRWSLPESEFDSSGVTVKRLLSHTAGLSLHGYPGLPPDEPLPSLEESLSGDTGGAGDVRLVQEPGTGFMYSGGGYTLLVLLIEEVTGERFCDYMDREVLQPLGMVNSGYCWDERLQAMTAVSYDENGEAWPNFLFGGMGCCGLHTSAADLSRFVAAGMPGPAGEPVGRGVLLPATVKLMYTPAVKLEGMTRLGGDGFGLGYFLEILESGELLVGHGGDNRGWHALFAAVPGTGDGLVVLANGDKGVVSPRYDLLGAWSESTGTGQPVGWRVASGIRFGSTMLALVLSIFALSYLFLMAGQLRSGKRAWGWRKRFLPVTAKLLVLAVAYAVVYLWWRNVAEFLGMVAAGSAIWTSLAVSAAGVTMVIAGISRKVKE